tara:strand:+ start:47 stop:277 length:231 start_codon:yes stop_codon:yes gene_type:complete
MRICLVVRRIWIFGSLLLGLKFFWEEGEMVGDMGCLEGVEARASDFRCLVIGQAHGHAHVHVDNAKWYKKGERYWF